MIGLDENLDLIFERDINEKDIVRGSIAIGLFTDPNWWGNALLTNPIIGDFYYLDKSKASEFEIRQAVETSLGYIEGLSVVDVRKSGETLSLIFLYNLNGFRFNIGIGTKI